MKQTPKIILLLVVFILLTILIFWTAALVETQDTLQHLVSRFGALGVVLVALISGFNLVVPIHAATFTPIFLAAGMHIPTIVVALVVGTTIADLLGYLLGRLGKGAAASKYPRVYAKVVHFIETRRRFVLPGIFLYSAFVPFPNEVILLPLGLFGFSLRKMLFPLILGTLLNQTIFVLGFAHVFELVF